MDTPSSRTINYDAVLSLCMEYRRPGLIDQIFTNAPFLAALYGAFGSKKKAKKGIRMVNGGERIRVPIIYGKNDTVGSYSNYDIFDVTPQDDITTAFYEWSQFAGSVSISRKEERQNAGEGRIKDLLQSKIMQLEMTMRDEANNMLIGKTIENGAFVQGDGIASQTANADTHPLLQFIPKDPTASVTIGNINRSTYSWWRPNIIDGSAVHGSKDSGATRGFLCDDWSTLKSAARHLYNLCSRGGGGTPDLGLMDQMCYESYEASLDDKVRYMSTTGPVTMGFESIRFKGQDLVWDEMMPDVDNGYTYDSASWASSTWVMINTQFLELVIDTATDFITTPFVRPENQDAKTSQILTMWQLTDCCPRKHGMIYGITAGIYA